MNEHNAPSAQSQSMHLLTSQEICLFWSAVQKEARTGGLNKSLNDPHQYTLHTLHKHVLSILSRVSHAGFHFCLKFKVTN